MSSPRLPTPFEAAVPVFGMIALLGVGYGLFGVDTELLLILASCVTGLVAWRLGYSWREMEEGIVEAVKKATPAMLIVTVVGALIASWIVSGTIPFIVYHGLRLVSPEWFLVTACILCSVVSLVIGTSWGTIGTVGVALIGIAEGLGVPLGPAAGAIVAGAYFGDKLSPFSDTTNLAPIAARANLYDHIGHMLWTTTPAWLVALGVYAVVGRGQAERLDDATVNALAASIETHFELSFVLLLPPLITFSAAVLKKPVIPSMLLSVAVAVGLAVFVQDLGVSVLGEPGTYDVDDALPVRILATLVAGTNPDTGNAGLDQIVGRGGMLSMMDTQLIALCAFAFAGIAERTRMLEVLLGAMSALARTTGRLVALTAASCLVMAGITGNSYMSILVPGELFRGEFKRQGLAAKNLSRTTEDAGTVIVPLIPWSIAAVFITNTLGVRTLDYAGWAVSCWIGIFVALAYGFTGIGIAKRRNEDETQPGS